MKIDPLLNYGNRIFRTDLRYLIKGGFWLLLGQNIGRVGGLILMVGFANLLPKETFGTYQYILSVATILSACTLTGIGAAVTRATARGNEGALRYGFRVKLLWSIFIVLASGAVASYYFINQNNTLAISFLLIGAFLPIWESFRLYRYYLRGKQLFKQSTTLGLGIQLIPLSSILLTLFLTDEILILLSVYFASNTIATGIIYMRVLRLYKPPIQPDADMLNLGKHLSFLNIIGMVAGHLDKVLIFSFLGAAPVAAYALAQTPITHMRKAMSVLTEMAIPKLSKRSFIELQETLPRKVRIFLLLTVLALAVYVLMAPFLFGLLFPDYPESILLTQVMALLILSYPRSIYSQAFTAHSMKSEIYITQITLSVVMIVFLIILLPLYGLWGAVFATLSAHLVVNLLTRYLFSRAKQPPKKED